MKIEHIALYTRDLEKSAEFFEKYFGGTRNQLYHNPKTGLQTYFIHFSDGARLELMSLPRCIQNSTTLTYGYAHIAFSLGSRRTVDKLTAELVDDGYELNSCPRITGDGYYESSVFDSEGNLIEITE